MHKNCPFPVQFEVDWNEQWELFCPYYNGTLCDLPLSIFCQDSTEHLLLKPGPGFGDLSHPTTHLMLQHIGAHAKGKSLIDLGCGSGILGLAALKLGARAVCSLDIDPQALRHTQENAQLNNLSVATELPAEGADILCLNMTFAEQKIALKTTDILSTPLWITSGILAKQKKDYLDFLHSLGAENIAIHSKKGWLSFILSKK